MWARCFFFNDTAATEIYTLSLHDALPIWCSDDDGFCRNRASRLNGYRRCRCNRHSRVWINGERCWCRDVSINCCSYVRYIIWARCDESKCSAGLECAAIQTILECAQWCSDDDG